MIIIAKIVTNKKHLQKSLLISDVFENLCPQNVPVL